MNAPCRPIAVLILYGSLLLACAGCQRPLWKKVDIHGAGYSQAEEEDLAELRPKANEKRFSGVDNRARDIERNLGVR